MKEEEEQQEEQKAVDKSSQPDMSPALLKEVEEKAPEVDVIKLFTQAVDAQPLASLYERLKEEPEALTLLAPAAGDTIISLDFSCPGSWPQIHTLKLLHGINLEFLSCVFETILTSLCLLVQMSLSTMM